MLTRKQLDERKSGLGGSDAPVALGLSKWRTPLDLYMEKIGVPVAVNQETERMRWGSVLEPVIADEWASRTGKRILAVDTQRHPTLPFLLGNVDRLIEGEDAGLEVKTTSGSAVSEWGEEWTDQVPLYYLVQVYHYAAVTGRRTWYFAVLCNGSELRTYVVQTRDDLLAEIVERERVFWECVQTRRPPRPQSPEDAARLFPVSRSITVEASTEVLAAVVHLRECREAITDIAADIAGAETTIKAYMGEADTLTFAGSTLATWRSAKPTQRIDLDALRLRAPKTAARYTITGEASRRFLLK